MGVYSGTSLIKQAYVGTQEVKRIYIGTSLVYEKEEWVRRVLASMGYEVVYDNNFYTQLKVDWWNVNEGAFIISHKGGTTWYDGEGVGDSTIFYDVTYIEVFGNPMEGYNAEAHYATLGG